MQQVSQAWKNAHRKTMVPEAFVEISLKIGDPDAQADMIPTDNGHEDISHLPDIVERTAAPPKYATLEPRLWGLDGSFRIVGGAGVRLDEYESFIPFGESSALVTAAGDTFYSKR